MKIFKELSSDAFLQKIDAIIDEGIIVADKNYNFIFLNPSARRILEIGPKENLSRKLQEEIFVPLFRELNEPGKKTINKELKIFLPLKEREKVIKTALVPIDEKDMNSGFIISLFDVSSQKEREKFQSELISHVSHELRTPLTTIKEFISILLDGLAGELNPTQKDYLGITHNNINRLGRIISTLLDVSRLEAGKVKLNLEIASIKRLIKQTVYFLKPHADKKNISLAAVSFPAYFPYAYIDVDRITQVLTNLIENAIKHTPPGGKIKVNAKKDKEFIRVSVIDNGEGIPPEDTERIFTTFYQIGIEAGPGAKGLGLGLPICKEIIKLHRGEIWVESRKGKGSDFSFTVPCYKMKGLSEYVEDNVNFSRVIGREFSILRIEVENIHGIEKKLGKEGIIIKRIKKSLEEKLRKAVDYGPLQKGSSLFIGLPNSNVKQSSALAERLVKELKAMQFSIPLSLIIRIATYPADGGTAEELIKSCMSTSKEKKFKIG
ncbi:MAG: ATP-binding protein [bacterium]